jgi:hypothetical protein
VDSDEDRGSIPLASSPESLLGYRAVGRRGDRKKIFLMA